MYVNMALYFIKLFFMPNIQRTMMFCKFIIKQLKLEGFIWLFRGGAVFRKKGRMGKAEVVPTSGYSPAALLARALTKDPGAFVNCLAKAFWLHPK